jgi:general stress protein 26
MDKETLLPLALDIMSRADMLELATMGGDPYPHVRAILNLRNTRQYPGLAAHFADKGLSIFVSTNTSSIKVKEVGAEPWVSAYFMLPAEYKGICLSGRAVVDPEAREAIWVQGWEMYYPKGRTDPDYAILRIDPIRARGWSGMAPFDVEL